ncbi:MAG: hypothetical protein Q4G10_02255, partial [Bacteroidia bacterium]|nr:hypothetical protein [Bacteroidia bacterium]
LNFSAYWYKMSKCACYPYDFNSEYEASHISLFTWSSTVQDAVGTSNSGSYLFCDESHKVSVNGSEEIYYAFSQPEWQYLLNNHVKVWGQCNSVNGLFIAPDGFEGDASALTSAVSDWATAEASGIVFLPAAGGRNANRVNELNNVGTMGRYWSTTMSYSYPYGVNSSVDGAGLDSTWSYEGFSIRLVTDAN